MVTAKKKFKVTVTELLQNLSQSILISFLFEGHAPQSSLVVSVTRHVMA